MNEFRPDYVSHPGETLAEMLAYVGMSQVELARRMGRPRKTVNEIIQGKSAITPDTALQLELVLGTPASFWNNRERQYQEAKARIAEEEQLKRQVYWLEDMSIPVQEMCLRQWINCEGEAISQLREVLSYFGAASTQQCEDIWESYEVVFRRTMARPANWAAVATWLRKGEIEAQSIECQQYSAHAFRNALIETRALTKQNVEDVLPSVVRNCASAGVAIVVVPALQNTGISGAARWLNPHKALLQLSLRYKSDDRFWFSMFHEGRHILQHSKKKVFLEPENGAGNKSKLEVDADRFAADLLIPPAALRRFLQVIGERYPSRDEVINLARDLGIAPGIVVGRLQFDKVMPFSNLNDLRCGLLWSEEGQIISVPYRKG